MAVAVGNVVGEKSFILDFYASAGLTGTAGQMVVREATATNIGEATNPASATSMTDVVGVLIDPTTSQTAPTKEPGTLLFAVSAGLPALENIARVDCGPFNIFRFPIAGGTAAGTVLQGTTLTPANIVLNTTASAGGTLISAATIGTINMAGGLVKGKVGNNAGSIRKISAHSDNTSETVGIAFLNALAVNDQFIRVPYSRACTTIQLTTNFVQANGIIAFGTGTAMRVVNVIIDEQNNLAWVDAIATLHFYNKNS